MAFTLAKSVELLESLLGAAEKSNWRLGNLEKTRMTHMPLSALPIRSLVEEVSEHAGNRRTLNN